MPVGEVGDLAEVERDRLDRDERLAGPGLRVGRVAEPQAAGSVGVVEERAQVPMLARRGPAVQDLLVFHPVMDPHVRDLRYFLAVARELQVSRAAETLYISQPALSKQIRALERQLRVPLFDREPGGVRLTRAGAELVPRAERIVAEWEAAKQALARASDCALVIGMQTSPGRGVLPKVCARLVRDCPEARLQLRQIGWADRFAGLADRATDAAFGARSSRCRGSRTAG